MRGPYPPTTAAVGGIPTTGIDVPISGVWLFLFILGAVGNFGLLKRNLKRGHHFKLNGMVGGFCFSRILTQIMRIVWATRPHNQHVAIAATIFTSAGIILIYILNFIFSQRLLRSACPSPKFNAILDKLARPFYMTLVLVLAALITTIVQSAYTRDQNILRIDRDIQLAMLTFFAALAFLPIPLIYYASIVRNEQHMGELGVMGRSWPAKCFRITFTSLLSTTIAGFHAGTAWAPPRPLANPAWYDSREAFYLFNFTLEIIIVYTFLFSRIDLHFWIPDPPAKPTKADKKAMKVAAMKQSLDMQAAGAGAHNQWFQGYGGECDDYDDDDNAKHMDMHDMSMPSPTLVPTNGTDWLPAIERGSWKMRFSTYSTHSVDSLSLYTTNSSVESFRSPASDRKFRDMKI